MFYLATITRWVSHRDSCNRVAPLDLPSGRTFLINTDRISDLVRHGTGSRFKYTELSEDPREAYDLIEATDSVEEITIGGDIPYLSDFITLPVFRKNDTTKSTKDTTINVDQFIYADVYNRNANYSWVVYEEDTFKRVKVLVDLTFAEIMTLVEGVATPVILSAEGDETGIDIVWEDKSSNEDGFEIWVSIDGGTYTLLDTVGAGVTSYTDTSSGGDTVDYRIRSYKGSAYSAFSAPFRSTFTWSDFWTTQPEVLFLGYYSEISGGRMPNKVVGSSDYLTVSGSAGSETYQCPNTAPYIAADTDYIWFKTDTTRRTTTTAELVGYDLQRTPVKYNDTAPHTIEIIMILKAGQVLSAYKRDLLFQYMFLPILWDGTINSYGHIKANRTGQQLWTPEATFDDASVALFARMTALGETPTDLRKTAIDTAIKALKAASLFDTKFEGLYVARGAGVGSTKLNWVKNAYNLTKSGAGTLTFTTDVGYHGDGNCALNPNYQPSAITGLWQQDNACFGFKVSGTIQTTTGYWGAYNTPRSLSVQTSNRLNCETSGGVNRAVGYNCLARNNAANFNQYTNASTTTVTATSTGKSIDEPCFLGAWNKSGNTIVGGTSTEVFEIGWLGAYISQAEFLTLQTIFNNYIASL